ncbi:MAG: family N-acetyltransferase [Marmoricola sp.]|nr:family N-acetyltransferase [Marmoricola sp.]
MIKSEAGHSLGPHVVGLRVVIRRLVRGETGPSGGPALTDLLGICESWGPDVAAIRAEDGTVTEIALADIVSGKPVPPRPSRFRRLTDAEVDARCDALRPGPRTARSVDVQLIGIARLARALVDVVGDVGGTDIVVSEPGEGLLRVEVLIEGTSVASASAAYDHSWALLTDLDVTVDHRRPGVRRLLASALVDVLAERGLSVLGTEIPADDVAAGSLASALGFELHHTREA